MTSQELKNSILQFAVQGKLIPQNPHDEPASELLKKISAERDQLIKKRVLKDKPSLPITEEEKPFEIPESWEWVRLGKISNFGNNESILSSNISDNKWILELEDIEKETGRIIAYKSKKERNSVSNKNIFKNGNVLYSKLRPYLNKVVIVNNDGYCSSEIFPLDFGRFIYNKYAQLFLMSPFFVDYANKKSYGTKMPRFSSIDGQNALFSLPPLAEQQCIVNKIEELLPYVEQYGTAESELRQLNIKFPEQLKRSVLQYAVQGKLIPQNPHDEPASTLLERIMIEKKQLIKEKKIKQNKPLSEIKEEEIPFEIPASWAWVRVGEIAEVYTGATPLTTNQEYYTNGNIPWITSGATGNLFVDKVDTFITEKAIKETNCKVYPIGTLIVAMYGQGKTRGQITELNTEAATNQACAAINLHLNDLYLRRYIKLLFQKIYAEIRELAYGGAQPNLNLSTIKETLIPLPPLSEQKLIVEKVEEVLGYCDKLK